jgi:hypothetical protein
MDPNGRMDPVWVVQKLVAEREAEMVLRVQHEEQISVLKHGLQAALSESEVLSRQLEEARVKVKAAQHAREALVQEVCHPSSSFTLPGSEDCTSL